MASCNPGSQVPWPACEDRKDAILLVPMHMSLWHGKKEKATPPPSAPFLVGTTRSLSKQRLLPLTLEQSSDDVLRVVVQLNKLDAHLGASRGPFIQPKGGNS